jgi:hypothetical protein
MLLHEAEADVTELWKYWFSFSGCFLFAEWMPAADAAGAPWSWLAAS